MLKNKIKLFDLACLSNDKDTAIESMRNAQSVFCRSCAKGAIKANKRNRLLSALFVKFNVTFNKEIIT